MVYGGVRNDRSLHIRGDIRVGARDGAVVADDVSADVHGVYRRLSGYRLRASADVLPPQTDYHILVSGTEAGETLLHDGSGLLPPVEDDGGGGEVLRGVHYPAAVCVRPCRHSVCRERGGDGTAYLAIYAQGRNRHAGVYRLLPDGMSLYGSCRHNNVGHRLPASVGGGGGEGDSGQRHEPHIRV